MKKVLADRQISIAQAWSKIKPRLAFTLAEVLVVIGIIGIVADLTLPNLIQNYQKQVYVTKLKKAYTVFNQALIQMSTDMGCPGDLKCTGLFDNSKSMVRNQNFGEEITKYMKVIKTANAGEVFLYGSSNDWDTIGVSLNYDGTLDLSKLINPVIYYRFITIDESLYAINTPSGNCSDSTYALKNICATVLIDINGFKPPNAYGRDRFEFLIMGDGPALYPQGGQKALNPWKNSVTGQPTRCYPGNTSGSACAGRVVEEGWQMNY